MKNELKDFEHLRTFLEMDASRVEEAMREWTADDFRLARELLDEQARCHQAQPIVEGVLNLLRKQQ